MATRSSRVGLTYSTFLTLFCTASTLIQPCLPQFILIPLPSASSALDMVTSPLDVTIFTRQLRRDPQVGVLVFINSPRPRAAMYVCLTRQLPTCIHCSLHLTRGLWHPHISKRDDIMLQTMVQEDRLRYSISPALSLLDVQVGTLGGRNGSPCAKAQFPILSGCSLDRLGW